MDKALLMGCSISCSLFETFSTFLEWVFSEVTGLAQVTHHLDDCFFVGTPGSTDCQKHLASFKELMEYLGLPLAEEKTVGPDTVFTFLDIEIDSRTMEARLPGDKKRVMLNLILTMLAKDKPRVKEVQVLLGHLNFACRVIRAGRTFCRRLGLALAGKSGPTLPHHRVKLSAGVK